MLLGAFAFKMAVAGMATALRATAEWYGYEAEYELVRADSAGKWVDVLDDMLVGNLSHHLPPAATSERREFTQRVGDESWQWKCASDIQRYLEVLGTDSEELPLKTDLRQWFRSFVTLRNKARGHGQSARAPSRRSIPTLNLLSADSSGIVLSQKWSGHTFIAIYRASTGSLP